MTTTITLPSGAAVNIVRRCQPNIGLVRVYYKPESWNPAVSMIEVAKVVDLNDLWIPARATFTLPVRMTATEVDDFAVILTNVQATMQELDRQYVPGSEVE